MLKMDGLILAGGRNSRMGGFFKAELPSVPEESSDLINDSGREETFLSRLIREMRPQVNNLWLSCGADRSVPAENRLSAACRLAERNIFDFRTVYDCFPDCGPMGGLHAGLTACREEWMAVAACDMPYLRWTFFRHLADVLTAGFPNDPDTSGASFSSSLPGQPPAPPALDGIVPVFGGRRHPLAAIYHRRTAAVFETCLQAGDRRIGSALDRMNICYADLDSLPGLASMLENVNTWEDYHRLRPKDH